MQRGLGAIVTGSTSGIGLAMSFGRRFAATVRRSGNDAVINDGDDAHAHAAHRLAVAVATSGSCSEASIGERPVAWSPLRLIFHMFLSNHHRISCPLAIVPEVLGDVLGILLAQRRQ